MTKEEKKKECIKVEGVRESERYSRYYRSRFDRRLTNVLVVYIYKYQIRSNLYSGFSRCHWTIVCRGFVIMSCQCFVSLAPLPFFPEIY